MLITTQAIAKTERRKEVHPLSKHHPHCYQQLFYILKLRYHGQSARAHLSVLVI